MRESSLCHRDRLKMMTTLISKPLHDWNAIIRHVRHRGYHVWEVWASPVIAGVHHEVHLRSDYPDARKVIVSLHRRCSGSPRLREEVASDLSEGVARAVAWLDALERPRSTADGTSAVGRSGGWVPGSQ